PQQAPHSSHSFQAPMGLAVFLAQVYVALFQTLRHSESDYIKSLLIRLLDSDNLALPLKNHLIRQARLQQPRLATFLNRGLRGLDIMSQVNYTFPLHDMVYSTVTRQLPLQFEYVLFLHQ